MTSQTYQKAKSAGYSDEEITAYLSKKDPTFSEKFKKAQDLGYKSEEIYGHFGGNSTPVSKEKELSKSDYAKDVGTQFGKGFTIGSIGSYGDLFDLFGLQAKETLPGEKAKYDREFDVLSKMQKGEETPSTGDLLELSSDDDIAPRYSRLPTSQDLSQIAEKGGIGKPKSAAGRYAERIGHLSGSGAVLPGGGIKAPIVAGAVGQTLEEAGAPPWAQAAGEILAFMKTMPKSIAPITSNSPEIKNVIERLRKAGFSEQDITLARNSLEDKNLLKKWAKMTPEAEKSINTAVENSEKLFKENIYKALPGYETGGMKALENSANELYATMEKVAQSVPVKKANALKNSLEKSIGYLKSHAVGEDQRKMINYLEDALSKVDGERNADFFTDFYRGLNKEGKWLNPAQKEHILRETKDAIKQTFSEGGPEANKFGKYFDKVNESWRKWIDVQDAMEILHKGQKNEGLNWKFLSKTFNDPEKMKLLEKSLGKEQAQNMRAISEGVNSIETLEKTLKSTKDKSLLQGLKAIEGIKAFFSGDYKTLAALFGASKAQNLATKMLTDVKYQNLMKKFVTASKESSPQQAAILARNLVTQLEKD